jgi:hypothetical protein
MGMEYENMRTRGAKNVIKRDKMRNVKRAEVRAEDEIEGAIWIMGA